VTGGKPIAVLLQSITGVSAINPLVAFYDIHGGKKGAILLFCPGHHTRLINNKLKYLGNTFKMISNAQYCLLHKNDENKFMFT
jgi:hypothetical protein